MAPVILTMTEFQGEVYFGGRFSTFDADLDDPNNPIVESNNIMKWDGTNFSSVGGGVFRAPRLAVGLGFRGGCPLGRYAVGSPPRFPAERSRGSRLRGVQR